MFAGGFLRARHIRRTVSAIAALLASVGGVLVLAGSLGRGLAIGVLALLAALASLLGAWWIYRGGKALLFPRARLTFAGVLTTASGAVLYILGFGVDALFVIVGGLVAWLATVL